MSNPHLQTDKGGLTAADKEFENNIRPAYMSDFSGQQQIIENLTIFIKAAKIRGEALDHVLFHGPPGLGKTTLSRIIANELGVILNAVARVQEVAGEDVPPTSHPLPLENVFRPDVVIPSLSPEEALSGAPAQEEQRFKVPQILGEE